MKYVVLIVDGAAGLPLVERGNRTCLEMAATPNLDALVAGGSLGMARTVPPGLEPGSAVACMAVLGYNPEIYYQGRACIEAASMGIGIGEGEVVFRCNLVTVVDGLVKDYSAGHISTDEAKEVITALNRELGKESVEFFPGVSYRHILRLKGHEDTLEAICTPPHDISGKPVAGYLPRGWGSDILRDLIARSETVLKEHPVNIARKARGELPVTSVWLFWGSGQVPDMPTFKKAYGLKAAMTSGVDLLRGLAKMTAMTVLDIEGVTDGSDNDNAAQAEGALAALRTHDLVVIHVEAPDEAGHNGDIEGKVGAIEKIDAAVVNRLRSYPGDVRVLVMPDHLTPISIRTHTPDPVPFLLWGKGVEPNGAGRFTEAEAGNTGVYVAEGYKIMGKLVGKEIV